VAKELEVGGRGMFYGMVLISAFDWKEEIRTSYSTYKIEQFPAQ